MPTDAAGVSCNGTAELSEFILSTARLDNNLSQYTNQSQNDTCRKVSARKYSRAARILSDGATDSKLHSFSALGSRSRRETAAVYL